MLKQQRYYVHGDILEDGKYYCAFCDGFVCFEHQYNGCKKESTEQYKRYRSSLKNWKAKIHTIFFRHDNSPNLFD